MLYIEFIIKIFSCGEPLLFEFQISNTTSIDLDIIIRLKLTKYIIDILNFSILNTTTLTETRVTLKANSRNESITAAWVPEIAKTHELLGCYISYFEGVLVQFVPIKSQLRLDLLNERIRSGKSDVKSDTPKKYNYRFFCYR